MRHLNAHRKLGRTSEHRMSMLRNLATSLINARDERIKTTVQKAKELRPFVERAITLAKRASTLQGEDTAAQSLHWFDLPRFWSEARRVLAPAGVLHPIGLSPPVQGLES